MTHFVIRSFLVLFSLMFLKPQQYNFDAIVHTEAPLGVEWLLTFMKIVWTAFEKFEISIERSGEKRYECISIQNFFWLLKNGMTLIRRPNTQQIKKCILKGY